MNSTRTLSNSEAVQEFDNKVIEIIPISNEEDSFGANGASGKRVCNDSETGFGQAKVKTLILFEDVDIIFPEDRGFVAAIQQIAEKAKGPVILTSNSKTVLWLKQFIFFLTLYNFYSLFPCNSMLWW